MAVLHFLTVETSTAGAPAPVPPKRVHFKGARIVARIFLSYRRDDSGGYAGRLYDRLSQHFGRAHLFMDVDTSLPASTLSRRSKTPLGPVMSYWP
jgi:hypothetical protein